MPICRELSCSDFKEIYREYVKQDFPIMERRPWSAIQKIWKDGEYTAYGYEEDGDLLAYASLYSAGGVPYVLLDYYAVIESRRGEGIGSAFLRELRTAIPDTGGILIEAEDPSFAEEEEERHIREERVSFYQKNEAVMTGVNSRLFGVDYSILYLSKNTELHSRDAYFNAVSSFYRVIYRPLKSDGRLCRVYLTERGADSNTAVLF